MANEKTWYSWVDASVADVATALSLAKSILWAIKAALKGEITGPTAGPAGAVPSGARWVCVGSSDSATAAMDGTDRWTSSYDASKLVRNAAGVHSWIVLRSPNGIGAGGPYYLTIDWNGSQDYQASFALSKTLPTGGTTSARPTSTDEAFFSSATQFSDNNTWTAAGGGRIHFTTDANGNFWICFSKNSGGFIPSVIAVQEVKNLRIPGDTWPMCLVVDWGTSSSSALVDGASNFYKGNVPTIRTRAYNPTGPVLTSSTAACLGYQLGSATLVSTQAGAFFADAKYEAMPLVLCTTTAGVVGLKGEFYDARNVAGNLATGSRYPSTGDVERTVVGSTLIPLTAVPTL